jgi:HEAT repeat protein
MRLRSAKWQTRAEAAARLGASGKKGALPALLKAAADESREVRIAAFEALARLRHPASAEPLAALLAGPHERLEDAGSGKSGLSAATELESLSKALGAAGAPAVAPLLRLLDSDNRDTRRWAARALGLTRNPQVVEPLVKRLADARSEVRVAAAAALGEIGDPRASAPLIAALSGRDNETRRAAALALGGIGGETSIDALRAVSNDPNEPVQLAVVEALARIGGLRAAGALRAVVDAGRKGVRETAASALKSMPIAAGDAGERAAASVLTGDFGAAVVEGDAAVPALAEALASRDAGRRRQAAEALATLRSAAAVAPLLRAMQDHDAAVQSAAAGALARTGAASVAGLTELLLRFDPTVQCLAARALGRIGGTGAAEALVAAIEQSRPLVRESPEALEVIQTACDALVNLLKERVSLGAPILERIAALPDTIGGTGASDAASGIVDCSTLRDLARRALEDR